jgi:hypothetical protein
MGRNHINSSSPKSGRVFLEVNDFCQSVSFRPPQAYFYSDKLINSVEIYGFDKSEAGTFIQFSRDIDSLKEQAVTDIERRELAHQKDNRSSDVCIIRSHSRAKGGFHLKIAG